MISAPPKAMIATGVSVAVAMPRSDRMPRTIPAAPTMNRAERPPRRIARRGPPSERQRLHIPTALSRLGSAERRRIRSRRPRRSPYRGFRTARRSQARSWLFRRSHRPRRHMRRFRPAGFLNMRHAHWVFSICICCDKIACDFQSGALRDMSVETTRFLQSRSNCACDAPMLEWQYRRRFLRFPIISERNGHCWTDRGDVDEFHR